MNKRWIIPLILCFSLLPGMFFASVSKADTCPQVKYKIQQLSEGISYPQITSGIEDQQIMDEMNRTFRKHAENVQKTDKEYKAQYAHDQLISAAGPYYAHTRPTVRFNSNCLLSVSFLDESYTGGAHGMHYEKVYNYDTRSGRQYHLNDIIHTKKELKKVNAYLKKQMIKLKNEGRYDFFLDSFKSVDLKNGQFYFYDHGIVIVFQEYEVAPYSNGIIHLKVPYHVFIEDRE
ncbi:DUF3298 and DUF4163 domain-containing protein [Sporolactobacillus shoreicorticis]|uniref:DUF3298 and DUF4163 domain-containing protein n=1 Tax=Sporolactobacillus shoreicorticis TaxID=1923877 RepID=A0ABW5RZY4_9BACL|nr:DUF3298 and DUF4163 domain-containing protein [Sporolactobacillus shoreicorticis]MCO7128035.1 DUF3298 and DUF4163 domain-containing protein [Sporolactobacillus shoreicorticis]